MTNNLRHWEALERTDPNHTKPFDRGRFKGTATKPIWNERRLTEHFGPCGIGWGMDKPEFTIVPAADEIAVFCTVTLWYKDGETTAMVFGVGGDKVLAQQKNGPFVNDESYKAAFTDALGNAMKHIGVNADIHMGRFDDHKYVRELREEFSEAQSNVEAPTRPAGAPARPTTAGSRSIPSGNPADQNAGGRVATSADQSHSHTPSSTGNQSKGKHPKWDYAGARFRELEKALKDSETEGNVYDIVNLNEKDLELIHELHPPSYRRLMALQMEMLAKLGAPRVNAGSAPMLMGEP